MKTQLIYVLLSLTLPFLVRPSKTNSNYINPDSQEEIYINAYDSVYYIYSNLGDVGSGVHLGNGYILTAKHVVENSNPLLFTVKAWKAKNSDGKDFDLTFLRKSDKYDLALLFSEELKTEPFVYVSESLFVDFGEELFAVGAIQENKRLIKLYCNKPNYKFPEILNTSGPIYHGNSGGGVFSKDGKLTGIIMGIGVHPMRYRLFDVGLATGLAAIHDFLIEPK